MNILITYDFLTTDKVLGKILCQHIDFIAEILTALGIAVAVDNDSYQSFSREKLCSLMGQTFKNSKFNSLGLDSLNEESLTYIKSYTEKYDLLLTYELSEQTKKLFDEQGITYIDLWMSPIRFHKDLMFSFYSNNKIVQNKLTRYQINDENHYKVAGELSDYCHFFKKDDVILENDCTLVIGQLFEDKSIMKVDHFLNLTDYTDEINEIALNASKVYFLKHPFMDESDFEKITEHFKYLPNFEYLSDVNVYSLLVRKEVKSVVAISSSVLSEAQYFGKDTKYLYKPVIADQYINVMNEFYGSEFWSELLDISDTIKTNLLVHDNFLRYKFNAFYAYKGFVDDNSEFRNYLVITRLFAFINDLDKNKDYVLYGYGSIGKLIAPQIKNNIKGIIDQSINENDLFDGFKVMSVHDLSYNDNVIITACIHKEAIIDKLKAYKCQIVNIDLS